ncbi:SpoIIE family protein phosphatase [Actinokineospora sp. G85]|uniref:SpoIIE family protein phosphatase n=1 Tax=Actinokineospora sp. G85 TaxID=3406626 RepID=UPI003C784D62
MGAARHALEGHSAMILRRLDVMLHRFHPVEGLTTMCVVLIDPEAGTMAVSNAGHIPPPVVDEHGGRYLDELCDRVLAKYGQGQQDDIALLVPRRT